MSSLRAIIKGNDSLPQKEISVEISQPLHSSIVILQNEVNNYLTDLVKNSGDDVINEDFDEEESDDEELKESPTKNKRTGKDYRLNKKIK